MSHTDEQEVDLLHCSNPTKCINDCTSVLPVSLHSSNSTHSPLMQQLNSSSIWIQIYTHQREVTLILALHFFTERNKDILIYNFMVIRQNLLVPGYHSDIWRGEDMYDGQWCWRMVMYHFVSLCTGAMRSSVCRQESRSHLLITLSVHL